MKIVNGEKEVRRPERGCPSRSRQRLLYSLLNFPWWSCLRTLLRDPYS